MKFNVRIYGLLIHEGKILLTKESRFGKEFTKFPGGGLEFGEGTKDCLIREFYEEFDLSINVNELFYINDFYQESAFNKTDQVISIYYKVSPTSILFSPSSLKVNLEKPLWVNLNSLNEDYLTFPIDKAVANKIARMQ